MKNKLIIGVDVDDTLLDMVPVWRDVFVEQGGRCFSVDQVRDWAFTGIFESQAEQKRFYGLLSTHAEELYARMKPCAGALNAIAELRTLGRVVFVTANARGMVDPKWDALVRHGFLTDNSEGRKDFCPVNDKTLIRADILVDDSMANIAAFPGHAVLIDQPHNQEDIPMSEMWRCRVLDIRAAPGAVRWIIESQQ